MQHTLPHFAAGSVVPMLLKEEKLLFLVVRDGSLPVFGRVLLIVKHLSLESLVEEAWYAVSLVDDAPSLEGALKSFARSLKTS